MIATHTYIRHKCNRNKEFVLLIAKMLGKLHSEQRAQIVVPDKEALKKTSDEVKGILLDTDYSMDFSVRGVRTFIIHKPNGEVYLDIKRIVDFSKPDRVGTVDELIRVSGDEILQ